MFTLEDIRFALAVLSPAVTLVVCGFLAIVVIYKNHNKEINRVFFLWMVVSAINSLFFLMGILLEDGDYKGVARFFQWLAVYISLLDPLIAIHFIMLFSFASKWVKGKWTAIVFYVPVPVAIFLIIVGSSAYHPFFIAIVLQAGLYLLAVFCIPLLIVSFFTNKEKTFRMQLFFIGVGILVMTFGFYASVGLNALNLIFAGLILTIITVPLASIILAITVLRFRLLGVETVIKKGIVFSLLSFIIVCLFIILGETLEFFFEDVSILGLQMPGILSAVIIALLILPLQGRLEKIINKIYPKREDKHIRQIRLDTYHTAVKEALADEVVTEKEKRLLVRLRESLEISKEDDQRIRREILDNKK
jgi:hypothetical protein